MMRLAFSLTLAVLLVACSDPADPTLDVDIVTGLAPGPEFNRVVIDVLRETNGAARSVERAETVAFHEQSFARGRRVARFPGVPKGDYLVRVTLMRPQGQKLVEQNLRFRLDGDLAVRLYLDRECVGVECPNPGGSAALIACLAGACVDPQCDPTKPDTHSFCGGLEFCEANTDCSVAASCATAFCSSGICVTETTAGACEADEWCNPVATENACQPVPESTLANDGGIGADLGVCGTICLIDGNPCTTGYFDCSGGSPVCTGFVFTPSGSSCGEGLACDGRGECVSATDGGTIDAGPDAAATPLVYVTPEFGAMDERRPANNLFTIHIDPSLGTSIPVTIRSVDPDCAGIQVPGGISTMDEHTVTYSGSDLVFGMKTGGSTSGLTGTLICPAEITVGDISLMYNVHIYDNDFERVTLANGGGEFTDLDAKWLSSPPVITDDGAYIFATLSSTSGAQLTEDGPSGSRSGVVYRWARATRTWNALRIRERPINVEVGEATIDSTTVDVRIQAVDAAGSHFAVLRNVIAYDDADNVIGGHEELIVCNVEDVTDVRCSEPLKVFEKEGYAGGRIGYDSDLGIASVVAFSEGAPLRVAFSRVLGDAHDVVIANVTDDGDAIAISAAGAVTPAGVVCDYAGVSRSLRYVGFLSSERGVATDGSDAAADTDELRFYVLDRNTDSIRTAFTLTLGADGATRFSGLFNAQFDEDEASFFVQQASTTGISIARFDLATLTPSPLSATFAGTFGEAQIKPTITRNGRYLFWTGVTDIETDDATLHGYVGDVRTGRFRRLTQLGGLDPRAGVHSGLGAVSGDGRWVALTSTDNRLVDGDTDENDRPDLLLGAGF